MIKESWFSNIEGSGSPNGVKRIGALRSND